MTKRNDETLRKIKERNNFTANASAEITDTISGEVSEFDDSQNVTKVINEVDNTTDTSKTCIYLINWVLCVIYDSLKPSTSRRSHVNSVRTKTDTVQEIMMEIYWIHVDIIC